MCTCKSCEINRNWGWLVVERVAPGIILIISLDGQILLLNIVYKQSSLQRKFVFSHFIANWLEGRTIKYTNFPAKYMNSRSKLHWNIHVVLCQVSVTWNKRWGIGIPEMHDHAERHSAFNTSSKWIMLIFLLLWYFFGIFPINVMFASILTLKTSTKLALITKL